MILRNFLRKLLFSCCIYKIIHDNLSVLKYLLVVIYLRLYLFQNPLTVESVNLMHLSLQI